MNIDTRARAHTYTSNVSYDTVGQACIGCPQTNLSTVLSKASTHGVGVPTAAFMAVFILLPRTQRFAQRAKETAMSDQQATEFHKFVAHSANVNCVQIGRKSGRRILTGGDDRKAILWEVGKAGAMATLTGHTTAVEAVMFDPNELLAAAGSSSGTIKVFDLATSKNVCSLTGHKSNIRCLDFHPFGTFVASGSLDTNVKIWDTRKKTCLQTYKGHSGTITSVKFSPDGHWLVSGSEDGKVKLWDLQTGKQLVEFDAHDAAVNCLEFHPKEFLLATGGSDRRVRFWDVESFNCVSTSHPEANPITSMAFNPELQAIYSTGSDSLRVHGWEPEIVLDAVHAGWGKVGDMMALDQDKLLTASMSRDSVSLWMVDLTKVNHDRSKGNSGLTFETNRPATGATTTSAAVPARKKSVHRQTSTSSPKTGRTLPVPTPSVTSATPVVDPSLPKDQVFASREKIARDAAKSSPPEQKAKPALGPSRQPPSLGPSRQPPSRRVPSESQEPEVFSPPAAPSRQVPTASATTTVSKPKPSSTSSTPSVPVPSRSTAPTTTAPAAQRAPATAAPSLGDATPSFEMPAPSLRHSTWDKTNRELVPSSRDEPMRLDVHSFLPKQYASDTPSSLAVSADDVLGCLSGGHDSTLQALIGRSRTLRAVGSIWQHGNQKQAIEHLVDLEDDAALVDVLNLMMMKPNLWNLDIAVLVLPTFERLLQAPYESYQLCACKCTNLIMKSFGQLIFDTIRTATRGPIDISKEERHEKCSSCYESLEIIKGILEEHQSAPGKVGSAMRRALKAVNIK
eukprot:m.37128 g.37128  ORF g.37128 m.37128 type:complete len:794 (-) comp10069_c1_seq2:235-2616(-)